jgi:hypothetical protein
LPDAYNAGHFNASTHLFNRRMTPLNIRIQVFLGRDIFEKTLLWRHHSRIPGRNTRKSPLHNTSQYIRKLYYFK